MNSRPKRPTPTQLRYRADLDAVRQRLTTWWNGGDIGRPALQITAPRRTPLEDIPPLSEPDGWVTSYSTRDFPYRVHLADRACVSIEFLGETIPFVSPDLAPNCLALFLGCKGVEMPGTVWCEPWMKDAAEPPFPVDRKNFYWDFCLRLAREQLRVGRGRFLLQFPDFIEGLDTLGAMRGSQELLIDLLDRPEWVHRCLREITDRYFYYYDIVYDLIRDETGGSIFWCWAPGRMAKFQCDFSAMIGPDLFGEFMVPVLREMTERVSYSMYHWDGPGAIPHHDHLLSLPRLNMLQWTPGAGAEPGEHRRWWPLYHKTVEAGKKVYAGVSCREGFDALKKEFGPKLKQFLIGCGWPTKRKEAKELIKVAEC